MVNGMSAIGRRTMTESNSQLSLEEAYALLLEGISFAKANEFLAAAALKDQGLAAHPDDPFVLHYAGVIEMHSGRLPEAAALLTQAVRLRDGLYHTEMTLGDVYRQIGDKQTALRWFHRASMSDPTSVYGPFRAAQVERESGNPARALLLLEKARALDPQNAFITAELAAILRDLGKYSQLSSLLASLVPGSDAHAAFAAAVEPALTAEPSAELSGLLADLRASQGRLEEALAAAEQAVSLAPDVLAFAEQRDALQTRLGQPPTESDDGPRAGAASGRQSQHVADTTAVPAPERPPADHLSPDAHTPKGGLHKGWLSFLGW